MGTVLIKAFEISAKVGRPIFIGQDFETGRRQLVPILEGRVAPAALPFCGMVLPGGVDSQLIHPTGRTEISARYGVALDDGRSFYIQNDGIRTVKPEYAADVFAGKIAPSDAYYFATCPQFEIYDESLSILINRLFISSAQRFPDSVKLDFYLIEEQKDR